MIQTPYEPSYTCSNNYHYPDIQDQSQQNVGGYGYSAAMESSANAAGSVGFYQSTWSYPSNTYWDTNYTASYRQTTMSPGGMTSDTSTTDSSTGFDMSMIHSGSVSSSTDYSEQWDADFSLPMPTYCPQPQAELLSNIGSSFSGSNNTAVSHPSSYLFPTPVIHRRSMSQESATHDSYNTVTQGHESYRCEDLEDISILEDDEKHCTHSKTTDSQAKTRQPKQNRTKCSKTSEKPRLLCHLCRESKDYLRGFRGEHELARHRNQKHSSLREVWVCVDLTPDRKLRSCDRCTRGHYYGTEYGGAEHFRRKHTRIFGPEMSEWLKGCTKRKALSMKKLKNGGWLKQIWVKEDAHVSDETEEDNIVADGRRNGQRALAPAAVSTVVTQSDASSSGDVQMHDPHHHLVSFEQYTQQHHHHLWRQGLGGGQAF